jgi:hypothetical protein
MDEAHKKAFLLVASVRAALKNGCKHFAEDGRLLGTELEILKEMKTLRPITVDESQRVVVTTVEKEMEKLS